MSLRVENDPLHKSQRCLRLARSLRYLLERFPGTASELIRVLNR